MKNQPISNRFRYALAGIKASIRTERSFRAHIIVAVFVVAVLLVTRPAPFWWAALLLAVGVMMVAELVNTAVEKLVDHLHPDQHEIIGTVKDTPAGAVLVACTAGALVFVAFCGRNCVNRRHKSLTFCGNILRYNPEPLSLDERYMAKEPITTPNLLNAGDSTTHIPPETAASTQHYVLPEIDATGLPTGEGRWNAMVQRAEAKAGRPLGISREDLERAKRQTLASEGNPPEQSRKPLPPSLLAWSNMTIVLPNALGR